MTSSFLHGTQESGDKTSFRCAGNKSIWMRELAHAFQYHGRMVPPSPWYFKGRRLLQEPDGRGDPEGDVATLGEGEAFLGVEEVAVGDGQVDRIGRGDACGGDKPGEGNRLHRGQGAGTRGSGDRGN